MIKKIEKPRGTMDILPSSTGVWQYVEGVIRACAKLYGFEEIRFPTFEFTELFSRGVGNTTDIVQKEMYTFPDRDGKSMSLRPEGTACVARSIIENGLYGAAMPLRLYYLTNFFRYEKPQAGRSREFFQFGVELYGSNSPMADADVIMLAASVFNKLKLKNIKLHINSIGCPECRKVYHKALTEYLSAQTDKLCPTCLNRLSTNPLRILDCKSPICKSVCEGAPTTLEYLCDDCAQHFETLKNSLNAAGCEFVVDSNIVRGLDYYTKTVFEFIAEGIGAQSTVCGGGRYDGLLSELGGPALSGVGFGMGITRLISAMETDGVIPDTATVPALYIAPLGDKAKLRAYSLVAALRDKGIIACTDICDRSLKAQMKYADKVSANYVIVLGEQEIDTNSCILQNMNSGEKISITADIEGICEVLSVIKA